MDWYLLLKCLWFLLWNGTQVILVCSYNVVIVFATEVILVFSFVNDEQLLSFSSACHGHENITAWQLCNNYTVLHWLCVACLALTKFSWKNFHTSQLSDIMLLSNCSLCALNHLGYCDTGLVIIMKTVLLNQSLSFVSIIWTEWQLDSMHCYSLWLQFMGQDCCCSGSS